MAPKKAKVSSEAKDGATLKVGDECPDFELLAHDESKVRLSDVWKDSGLVIFMYPKVTSRYF